MYVTYHQNKTTSKLYKARNILNLISWSEGRKMSQNKSIRNRELDGERERELKGRVPVASHAAAGGGQSNHAEVPRFNLCVRERERRERRVREGSSGWGIPGSIRERERWKRGQRSHRCSRGWGKSRGGWPGSYGGASEPRWRRRWRTLPRGRDRRNCLY